MKNSYSSYRFIVTLLLLITLGIGNMWGWTAVYLNGTFDVTGGSESPNWNDASYQINYELEESNSGHYFLPFYATSGDKYWRLYQQKNYNNYQLSPSEDNYIQNVGTPGYKVGKNGEKNFKSTTILTGVTAVHINQGDGNGDESPGVWLERPTIYIWHNWRGNTENWGNNGGSGQQSMTDNEDGTYSYDGNYSGSSTGTNVGIEGSKAIKKYFDDDAATKYGTLTAGDLCRFVWNADGYVGYDGETDHRGALSIYKLYTITYHTDGSTSGSAPTDATYYPHGSNAPVLDNTGLLARADNKVFAGWATTAERATAGTVDYDPAAGDKITSISANMNLYPVWKTGYYFISLAGRDANGTKNTTDFFTPKNLNDNTRRAVNGIEFSKSVFRLSKTPNDGDVEQTFAGTYLADGKSCFIYDTKTTQTDISIYVFNDSTDALPIYYRVLKEGSVQDVESVDIPANSGKVVNIPTITHTKGTRVLFGAGDRGGTGYTKINFAQVRAIETGTAVPQAGQAGFELAVPGRFTTSSAVGSIDGLSCVAGANVVLVSGEKNNVIGLTSSLDVEATQYVQFTTTAPVQLQVTPADGGRYMYYVKKDSKTRTSSDVRHGERNTMTKVNLPEAGTWYILGGTNEPADNINISKIAFVAAPVITYHKNDGSATTTTGTCNVEANSFDRSGYTFLSWNTETDGSGETYEVDAETLTDLTLYAQWGKNPTITYHTDGSSSGTAPAAATITYNTGITVKDNTGLLQHATKVFAGWATSASSATIDYLPNATIENITDDIDLYPVWKDGAYFISLSGSGAIGTRNDADFLTGQKITSSNPAYVVNEVAFSRSYFKFGGTPRGSDPQDFSGNTVGSRFVAYDTKTDNTDIYVYLYNSDAAAKTFYYRVLKEGAIEDVQEVIVAASAKEVLAIPTIEHSKGTRVLFGVSDEDNLFITQIKAVESGAALPQAGQDGYELSFPGRAVGNAKTGSIDGLEFSANANVKILESNYISLTGTSGSDCSEYIKFTISEPMQLQVSCDNSRYAFYVKQGTTFTTGTDTEYSAKNTTTSINLWDTGDWYILASEAHITKVAFVDLSSITYNLNGGTRFFADPDYYTSEQEVTLHPASMPGYVFGGWYDNAEFTGSPITTIPVGSTDNKTFYAKWTEASCAIGNIFTYTNYGSEPGNTKLDLADGQYVNCAPSYATITGGTAVYGSTGRETSIEGKVHRLYFTHNNSRLIINLGCALQEGDSITITGTSSCVYALTASNERSTDIVTSCESDGDTKKSTYIIPAGSPLEGASTLYVWRNESTAYLLTLTIYRKELIIEGDGNWSEKLSGVTIDDAVKLRGTITVDVTDAQAKAVTLDHSGTHAGKLIVNAGKELVVAQTVRQFNGTANVPTEEENLVLGSSADGNGALVMGTHDGTNQATVYFYSKSGGAKNSTASINQFIGTPFVSHTNWVYNYYNSWLLKVDYSADKPVFALLGSGATMDPFAGYCVIYNGGAGHTYEMTGTLVATTDKTCSDLHYVSGTGSNTNNENLLANSWTAPIRIAAFETSDFVNTDATVYIFNSGSKDDVDNKDATKGQYITIPISSADDAVIPSMQSFSVYTNASGGSSVTLDYSKLVYDPAVAGTAAVGPNKAPQREETTRRMRILVQGESGFGDVLSLLEREDMTVGFDNGWDGRKMYGESFAPQFYAVTPDGNMAVNSVPDWEGTVLGFKAGTEDTQYTFSFEYNDSEPLYLLDIDNNTYTRVLNENTYTFATTDKNDHSRFILTRHAPQTPTEVTNVLSDKAPCTKILLDNNLYILRDGRLYNVTGAMVK